MINPSSSGWITKFFATQKIQRIAIEHDDLAFYKEIRSTGLLYGHPISFENIADFDTQKWTIPEFSKVALLVALYNVFEFQTKQKKYENFLENVVVFYKKMNPDGFRLLKKILPEGTSAQNLEEIISNRIQTNESILTRNFSHILTNALLFEDVLAYQQFLIHGDIPENYIKNLEETIVGIVSLSLKIKETKSTYNDLLIKLFESSFRYTKFSKISVNNIDNIDLKHIKSNLEKFYLLDLAVLAIWNDSKISSFENHFLLELSKKMAIADNFIPESVLQTDLFLQKHKTKIPFFNYTHPVKHFYDHTVDNVKVLIERNKLRLTKELGNNGELALLLTHSTHRSLDDKEKKKVKKQLLEICKAIPSLAVFLLPGGSLLLPILIKFIPKLLPTTFNENLENE